MKTIGLIIGIIVLGLLICWIIGTTIQLIKTLKTRQRAARENKSQGKEKEP